MSVFGRLYSAGPRDAVTRGGDFAIEEIVRKVLAASGAVVVTDNSALSLSCWWACINVLASDIGKLPMKVFERTDGDPREATEHPLYPLLSRRVNPCVSSQAWREASVGHMQTRGNGYTWIRRNGLLEVVELWPLHPCAIEIEMIDDRMTYIAKYDSAGRRLAKPERIRPEDMLHFHGPGSDGIQGYSVLDVARQSLERGLAARLYGLSFFRNVGRPSGSLEHPSKLSKEAYERLAATFAAEHGGAGNVGKTVVLEEGMKWNQISLAPEEAQYIQTEQYSVEDICRFHRVPPHKIQHLLRSTFSNIEHQGIEYVVDTLTTLMVRIETECNEKLFGPAERGRYYVKLNADGLLRGDSMARAEFYNKLFQIGAINRNEIRRREDLPSLGPDGDVFFVNGTMVPVERQLRPPVDASGAAAATVIDVQAEVVPDPRERAQSFLLAQSPVLASVAARMAAVEANARERAGSKGKTPDADWYNAHEDRIVEAGAPACEAVLRFAGLADANQRGLLAARKAAFQYHEFARGAAAFDEGAAAGALKRLLETEILEACHA